ncbi:hypothetical protein CG51_04685 [Haematobacter missouriensis]|uniref:Divergent polysaccharide deacetylase family protein n=2 Tax=Haematobacter missouriensis TaxID=366616 RepID=A0A212AXC6_9RHOB|nr:hypothetical protein CG51_04685 [Haematobacter missouriensis]OWJ86143.1 hypothetical protein CDV52_03065 [Haematobacter missouriensis]
MAVGVVVAAGASVLSIPRQDAAPAVPLPRVSSDSAGAEETPPPPPAAPAPQPSAGETPATETPGGELPDGQTAAGQTPAEQSSATQNGGEATPPAAPATTAESAPVAEPAPEPPAFEPPPPPETEPPAEIQPPPSVPASDSDAPAQDMAVPPAAPPPPEEASAVESIPVEPQPAVAPQAHGPRLAILLLDDPEMPDLAERVGEVSFPVSVALDPRNREDAARFAAEGVELVAVEREEEQEPLSGATARLRLDGQGAHLFRQDGGALSLPLIASASEEPVSRPLDRALYRAAQSGAAALLLQPTEENIRALGEWLSHTEVEVVPLSTLEN